MKRLAIIGTKEFAEQITDFALQTGQFEVVGYYDNIESKGSSVNGRPVFGTVEDAITGYHDKVFDEIFIGVGYTRFDLREQFYEQLKGKVPFANIIMPSAEVSPTAKLGEGVYVGPHTTIAANTIVENNVFVHGHCLLGHDCHIRSHSYFSGRDYMAGFCNIGAKVFVGLSVCVADHISITDDVWVGIGSIVAKDLTQPGKYMSASTRLVRVE